MLRPAQAPGTRGCIGRPGPAPVRQAGHRWEGSAVDPSRCASGLPARVMGMPAGAIRDLTWIPWSYLAKDEL